ncbi:tRNA (adenine(22)-N(1))-methyltransferase TrmK [Shewanella sp. UCD-KL12]|uniref:tRNA (adenine(22)-N(1))-methyltransferase n=1 Tax=Shewanella sp. UCD-KL12 TaxID=1917163 RepID=UPI00097133B6|nr:tRNA (adenine(22)-N(1))-methyltransferase TrmK [Shewanella sp. UCD-KL12]
MKISQRLQQIDKMINQHYDHIWDCCCDHGLLGARLLKRETANTIHFVDVVDTLMLELEGKLQRFFPQSGVSNKRWQVHCMDVAHLPLEAEDSQESHLIIIAGVGGELVTDLVKALLARYPAKALEFILCPVHHNYLVRTELATLQLGLVNECLVEENKRFYEVLHLSTSSQEPISNTGKKMWDLTRDADRRYLSKTLDHYRNMSKSSQANFAKVAPIIEDYEKLNDL